MLLLLLWFPICLVRCSSSSSFTSGKWHCCAASWFYALSKVSLHILRLFWKRPTARPTPGLKPLPIPTQTTVMYVLERKTINCDLLWSNCKIMQRHTHNCLPAPHTKQHIFSCAASVCQTDGRTGGPWGQTDKQWRIWNNLMFFIFIKFARGSVARQTTTATTMEDKLPANQLQLPLNSYTHTLTHTHTSVQCALRRVRCPFAVCMFWFVSLIRAPLELMTARSQRLVCCPSPGNYLAGNAYPMPPQEKKNSTRLSPTKVATKKGGNFSTAFGANL